MSSRKARILSPILAAVSYTHLDVYKRQEVESDHEEVMITTAFEDFGTLSHKLEELGMEAKSAELERIPNNSKEVSEDQFKANMKMLDRFEEDDDVQNVYHNMEITESLL